MGNTELGKRLIAKAEVLGKESGPDRTIIHRVMARLERLDPDLPSSASIRKNAPLLLHFLTADHPKNVSPFQVRHLEMIARGTLIFFLGEFGSGTALADPAESAWLFSYTANEITTLLPSLGTLREDHLTPEAAREAENQLIELAGTPCLDPEALIREVRHKMEEVGHLPGQPFTVDMLKNTEEFAAFLIHHTSRPGFNANDYRYRLAIGALRYLVKDNDVIDDRIGVKGYLDDAFVLKLAMDLFRKNSPSK